MAVCCIISIVYFYYYIFRQIDISLTYEKKLTCLLHPMQYCPYVVIMQNCKLRHDSPFRENGWLLVINNS